MLAVTSKAVWILTVVLSGDENSTRQYEFLSEADCETVIPAIQEMYLALGESEVNAICAPGNSRIDFQPLSTNMILSI